MTEKTTISLPTDFFNRPVVRLIRSKDHGSSYTIILIRMLMMAGGKTRVIKLNEKKFYDIPMLSTDVDIDINTVNEAIKLFRELGIVQIGAYDALSLTPFGLIGTDKDAEN